MKSIVNGKCVYPTLDYDKRVTVTENDIKKMKKLRKKGIAYHKIAEKLDRQVNVVKAYLVDGYSKQFYKYTSKVNKRRYDTDESYRQSIKESVRERQRKRYQNDVEYRIYLSCRRVGCKILKKRYGSLEKYREYKIKIFKLEKDPKISKDEYKIKRRELRKRYLIG